MRIYYKIFLLYRFLNLRHLTICQYLSFGMATLETLKFDNLALKRLPLDSIETNYVRTVNNACFSLVSPTPVKNPQIVAYSLNAMSLLNLSKHELDRKEFAQYFSGNKLLPGSQTAAHCYCGHQFGYFAGQLGDGAAIYLGEIINDKNERWEIQLKGAGLTPYSRSADGRKVLRSSIREFLCSEAMHFLGIPTTRAGACITCDDKVLRDKFNDYNLKMENCAIVLRIAPSFIRFGSFEIFKTRDKITSRIGPSVGRIDILTTLLDYVIETFYPEIYVEHAENQKEKYAAFFKEVVVRTARLVALWQSVGFCHGVLNTDNMSILGLTLDYGPFGFLDIYNPDHICNASDTNGRYSYKKQPEICYWNLLKLAEAIQQALPLNDSYPLLELYENEFYSNYMKKMRDKLGLIKLELPEDKNLIEDLFNTMEKTGADFTNTFCCLQWIDTSNKEKLYKSIEITKIKIIEQCYPLEILVETYKARSIDMKLAKVLNLIHIDSNTTLSENLKRIEAGIPLTNEELEALDYFKQMRPENKKIYDDGAWTLWLHSYTSRLQKEMEAAEDDLLCYHNSRLNCMLKSNPRIILRNHLAENAIQKAENGDFSEVRRLLKLLENPYEVQSVSSGLSLDSLNLKIFDDAKPSTSSQICHEQLNFDKAPEWAFAVKVT